MTFPLDPPTLFAETEKRIGHRYRLERLVAASAERVLFVGRDNLLNRRIGVRVIFAGPGPLRTWFMREAEAMGQLDHPAIRRVYDVGVIDDMAFRISNWVEAEGLAQATARGPRPIPLVHVLARDLLRAMEHAHANGIILRRVVPTALLVTSTGRGTIVDLRFCSYTLPYVPPTERPSGSNFMAPELREGALGDAMSDIYAAGAVLYFAITGVEPHEDPDLVVRPSKIRATCPKTLERVVLRALRSSPNERYLNASEMLEDFASEAGAFTTMPTLDGTPPSPEVNDSKSWEKRLRRALGDDYELIAEIGAGAFGRVYRVRDLHLERMVALKVLHPVLTQEPADIERFRREAQIAARTHHPNIVAIYEIGGRTGLVWYTMELVDGPNLAQSVEKDGPFPVERVVWLLRETLGALAHAHAIGMVHRDIKPENLLLARPGELKVTDFGLAMALRGQGRFGGASSRSGTPQFAAPEQLLGDQVDIRADLYSTAAVGCFALLGYPPFSGPTPEAVLAKQATNQLPDLAAIRPDVGPALAAVLSQALQSDKQARFASAGDFLQALNRAYRRDQRRSATPKWLADLKKRVFAGREPKRGVS